MSGPLPPVGFDPDSLESLRQYLDMLTAFYEPWFASAESMLDDPEACEMVDYIDMARRAVDSSDLEACRGYLDYVFELRGILEALRRGREQVNATVRQRCVNAAEEKRRIAEEDGAALTRRYERLRASADEQSETDIYRQIARELDANRLTLQRPLRIVSVPAVARRIQRYRKPLR